MRLVKYVVLGVIALVLIVLALANRDPVTLNLLPSDLAAWAGASIPPLELPLFLVIFIGVALGLLIGRIAEWLREYRYRKDAKVQRRARSKLEREVATLKGHTADTQDDVLALLEDGSRTG